METKLISPTKENILFCAKLLKAGEVIAIPTETVYGLAADAFCEKAVENVFAIKNRPTTKPLICNISSLDMLFRLSCERSFIFKSLIKKFWPGPLTIVVKKISGVLDLVTAGGATVAIRFSSNDILKKLTDFCGGPLVIPSANISGSASHLSAKDVYKELKGKVKVVLDGGNILGGVESTIICINGNSVEILRHGAISDVEIEKFLSFIGGKMC